MKNKTVKKEPSTIKYLTVQQYAERKGVHKNQVYALIEDGTIELSTDVVEGKGFIEWDKYKDLVIGDRKTTIRRRIINGAVEEITSRVLAEVKK